MVCQAGIAFIIQERVRRRACQKHVDRQEERLPANNKQGVQARTKAERERKVFLTSLGDPGVDVLYATTTENVLGSREIQETPSTENHWQTKNCEVFSRLVLLETAHLQSFSTRAVKTSKLFAEVIHMFYCQTTEFWFFASFSLCLTHLYWKQSAERVETI